MVDIIEAVKYGLFGWIKDKQAITYTIALSVLLVIMNVVLVLFFWDQFISLSLLGTMTSDVLVAFGKIFLFFIGYVLVQTIIMVVFEYLFLQRALEGKGLNFEDLTLIRFVKVLFYSFITSIFALLSIFRLKWLLIVVAAAILGVIGIVLAMLGAASNPLLAIVGILLLGLAGLLSVVYFVLVVYSSLRMSLGLVAFIEEEKGIIESLKESWDITKGNLLAMIATWFLIGILIWFLVLILSLPSTFYHLFIQMVSAVTLDSTTSALAYLKDPVYIILQVPVFISTAIISVISAFTMAAIYADVKRPDKKVHAPKKRK